MTDASQKKRREGFGMPMKNDRPLTPENWRHVLERLRVAKGSQTDKAIGRLISGADLVIDAVELQRLRALESGSDGEIAVVELENFEAAGLNDLLASFQTVPDDYYRSEDVQSLISRGLIRVVSTDSEGRRELGITLAGRLALNAYKKEMGHA